MAYDISIVGAGYVGMPLAQTFAEAGHSVLLVDVEESVVAAINRGESHITDVSAEELGRLVSAGSVEASTARLMASPPPRRKCRAG